jgi:hypothetical protein
VSTSIVEPPLTPARGINLAAQARNPADPGLDFDWQPLQPSHQELISPVPATVPGVGHRVVPRLGAVVVPTSRPRSRDGSPRPGRAAVELLAVEQQCPIVFLASGEALRDPGPTGDRAVVAEFDAGRSLLPPMATSVFSRPGVRPYPSDLAAKRNTAVVLGLLCGWDTWHFRDDDLTPGPAGSATLDHDGVGRAVERLQQKDECVAVGFQAVGGELSRADGERRGRSDNSVVAHARRLLGWQQDVFIGGGALVVRQVDRMPFFPSVYNEDWLFLLALAVERGGMRRAVAHGGSVRHEWYDPFRAARARREEFGDVLAEGLFSVLHQHDTLRELVSCAARHRFWRRALSYRRSMVQQMIVELGRGEPGLDAVAVEERRAARLALRGTLAELDLLRPESFVTWMRAWRDDLVTWHAWLEQTILSRAGTMAPPEALEFLGQRVRGRP